MPVLTWRLDKDLAKISPPTRSYDLFVDGEPVRSQTGRLAYFIVKDSGGWRANGETSWAKDILGKNCTKKEAKRLGEEAYLASLPATEAPPLTSEWAVFQNTVVRKAEAEAVETSNSQVYICLRSGRVVLVDGTFEEVCAKLDIPLS
jgi:hypothetical protein